MTESDKIRGIIELAVEAAFIDFPRCGRRGHMVAYLQRIGGMPDLGNRRPLGT